MYFLLKNGDIPASYVSLPEGLEIGISPEVHQPGCIPPVEHLKKKQIMTTLASQQPTRWTVCIFWRRKNESGLIAKMKRRKSQPSGFQIEMGFRYHLGVVFFFVRFLARCFDNTVLVGFRTFHGVSLFQCHWRVPFVSKNHSWVDVFPDWKWGFSG